MTRNVLIQLLNDLHQELTTCLEFKSDQGFKDPILLGDFIVDTYNTYLSQAKTIGEDSFINSLKDIEPWNVNHGSVEQKTKIAKMREILFATQTLRTLLEQKTTSEQDNIENELLGIISLLESLGQQLHPTITLDGNTVKFLAAEYNRCLSMVLQIIKEPFLNTLFQPLEMSENGPSNRMMLEFAHRSLSAFLKKRRRQTQMQKKSSTTNIEGAIANEIRGKRK